MADDWEEDATRRAKAALISTTVPNAARVADYLYGGQNNFEADRRAARALAATAPVIATIAPAAAGEWSKMMPAQPITLRSRSEVACLTAGLNPVPPGLVPVTEWRPDPEDPRFEDAVPVHGIVARKP
jgi:hypothetical protein